MCLLLHRVLLFVVRDFSCWPPRCCAVVTTLLSTVTANLKRTANRRRHPVKLLQLITYPVQVGNIISLICCILFLFAQYVLLSVKQTRLAICQLFLHFVITFCHILLLYLQIVLGYSWLCFFHRCILQFMYCNYASIVQLILQSVIYMVHCTFQQWKLLLFKFV